MLPKKPVRFVPVLYMVCAAGETYEVPICCHRNRRPCTAAMRHGGRRRCPRPSPGCGLNGRPPVPAGRLGGGGQGWGMGAGGGLPIHDKCVMRADMRAEKCVACRQRVIVCIFMASIAGDKKHRQCMVCLVVATVRRISSAVKKIKQQIRILRLRGCSCRMARRPEI